MTEFKCSLQFILCCNSNTSYLIFFYVQLQDPAESSRRLSRTEDADVNPRAGLLLESARAPHKAPPTRPHGHTPAQTLCRAS